ncbi:MAG: bifunctional proline dehydrogenase/L-glutamate gamma-semialdehyde dehydrogenase PutA [Neisseriaceae bacterium]|nr:MAG: bifunctional proline dehydrogenase/L-glutamate gamma-semialdehyde dehydrogenase PutA [Neisseriaceae bacterium]
MVSFTHKKPKLRQIITEAYRRDEDEAVKYLLSQIQLSSSERQRIADNARRLIQRVRSERVKSSGVDALMHEFSLSNEEGVALMCLAEALLRIPDKKTQDLLIKDKLSHPNWMSHINNSDSIFVNAAAWGLLFTGKLTQDYKEKNLKSALFRVLNKGGEPLIRKGIHFGMRLLGKQFVTGESIDEALQNAKKRESRGYRYSFDMLGEAALTQQDAQRYFQDYVNAIYKIGKDATGRGVYDANGISVKLSAIHPRYQRSQYRRVMSELLPRLKELFLLAKQYDIGLNIDAEEANRLDLSLDIIEELAFDPDLEGFQGIGIVVQAYQKRCPYVIDYLVDLAKRSHKRFMVRLVKGAYWDSEIKVSQVEGLEGFPVYTRKAYTDLSYLVCAKKLLQYQDEIYPQFATHNAYTASAIFEFGKGLDYEFQCLHGMGETLYDQVVGDDQWKKQVRVYAPVGTHETLLAYLVRRLLENGANTSFVNQIMDKNISIDDLLQCPIDISKQYQGKSHPALKLPRDLYPKRLNSCGLDLSNEQVLSSLENKVNEYSSLYFKVCSLTALPDEQEIHESAKEVLNPSWHQDKLGEISYLKQEYVGDVVRIAQLAQKKWSQTPIKDRAEYLRSFALKLEEKIHFFIVLAVREAGKTYPNAIAEIREAIDFCRYYADEVENLTFNTPSPLGTLIAISPWNFPLAIFIGELVAALVVGNTVIAKPAEQTSIIAYYAVRLLHEIGIPKDVLQLVLGDGEIGASLTQNPSIRGVIFTGSTQVAHLINKSLARNIDNPILIAETGGQNAMIVDSSALTEQVVLDVLNSAFDSAGQRCSALRILCLQNEIADKTIEMLIGAMKELKVGNPLELDTDIGAVIDKEAQNNLLSHIEKIKMSAVNSYSLQLDERLKGTFVPPTLVELKNLNELKQEVFGPVLHVIRFKREELNTLIQNINAKGYALTHGIHSRIDSQIANIIERIQAGNIYVNRNIVGAVVGVQPFGGHGLSGTGPKAGGAFYLQKIAELSPWEFPPVKGEFDNNNSRFKSVLDTVMSLPIEDDMKSFIVNNVEKLLNQNQLIGCRVDLTGPTGEDNYLTYRVPESVLLLGDQIDRLLVIFCNLALLGVNVFILENNILSQYYELLRSLGLNIIRDIYQASYQHVVVSSRLSREIQVSLSQYEGSILKIIDMSKHFDFLPLYHEISVSVNTTAAGGNASLMSLSDHLD